MSHDALKSSGDRVRVTAPDPPAVPPGAAATETGRGRGNAPIAAVALFAAAVIGVGVAYWGNAGDSDFTEQPPVAGVHDAARGAEALDVYVVPASSTAAGADSGSWRLAGALTVTDGAADQLVSVEVDGAPAVISNPDGAAGSVAVTGSDVTDIGFAPSDPQVTVHDPAIRAGLDVPVTLTFAHHGEMHLQVPVLTTLTGPHASAAPAEGGSTP